MPKLNDERFPAWHMRNQVGKAPKAAAATEEPGNPAGEGENPGGESENPDTEPAKSKASKPSK
jgi:hypothetical protein